MLMMWPPAPVNLGRDWFGERTSTRETRALGMFKTGVLVLGAAAAAVVVTVLVYVVGAPLSTVLSIGFGAISLFWLLVLLTFPWNLYFQAHDLIREIRTSRERGIGVSAERETEARRIRHRMLWTALAGHVLSAGVIAVVSYVSGLHTGYYFAGFYLLSTLFRPATAYFGRVRERLRTTLREVKHPRADVEQLRTRGQLLGLEGPSLQL